MFGIAPAEFLAHLEIGSAPEAPKVYGELHGLVAGREEFHQNGALPFIHPRGIQQAEAFLQPDPEDRDFGPLAEDVLIPNDEDGWLRVVSNADYSATFTCDADGSNAKISFLELVSDAVEGPRGVRLGDSVSMDLNRFRNGDGEISDDALYEMLYGTEGAAPWGKAFYLDGDGMTCNFPDKLTQALQDA